MGLTSIGGMALMAPKLAAMIQAAQPPGQPELPDAARTVVMLVPIVMLGMMFLALPLIRGLFYSGKNVRATCEARDPKPRWTDRCPLPVLAVSLWLAFGTLSMFVMPAFHSAAPLFGMLLSGVAGSVFYLFLAVVWAYCAWGALPPRSPRMVGDLYRASTVLCFQCNHVFAARPGRGLREDGLSAGADRSDPNIGFHRREHNGLDVVGLHAAASWIPTVHPKVLLWDFAHERVRKHTRAVIAQDKRRSLNSRAQLKLVRIRCAVASRFSIVPGSMSATISPIDSVQLSSPSDQR
jgi:hypothetical protein